MSKMLLQMSSNYPLKIWLAEDDLDDAIIFSETLKEIRPESQLEVVENGEQLMEQLRANDTLPNFIFLDLNMPRKNGLECLKEIKTSDELKLIKVIILTTSASRTEKQQCYDLGVEMFITKPTNYSDYKSIIYTCLNVLNK